MRNLPCAVLLTASMLSSVSDAGTITVSPTSSITSLTTALQIADAGDTILLKTGVYHEAVLIPSTLDSLTIRGVGNVILDARVVTGLELGAAIVNQADGVTIRDLTIRNAATVLADAGDGIRSTGLDTIVSGCTLIGNEAAGIRLAQSFAVVSKCTFIGNANGIVLASSGGSRIEKCTFRSSLGACAVLTDTIDVVFDKCVFEGSAAGGGIDSDDVSTNPGLVVRNCKFRALVGPGIRHVGNSLTVEKCSFRDSAGHGITVDDSGFVTVTGCSFANLSFQSSALVLTSSSEATIEKCSVTDVSSVGLSVTDSTGVDVRSSSFKRGGRDLEPCVFADGSTDVSLEKVTIADWGEGVRSVDGSVLALTSCTVSNCVRDGFDVESTSGAVTLTKCKATGCSAEGLDNGGPTTDAVDCTFKSNRIDVANDGTLTLTGGSHGTGGTSTPPAID